MSNGPGPLIFFYPKTMRPVAILGIGKTKFGTFPNQDLLSLAVEAGEKCFRDSNLWPSQIESLYVGNFAGPSFTGQNHLAPYIATALNMRFIPATRIENACASSGSAFHLAYREVASGASDATMVIGVEKMTTQPTPRVTEILAAAGDCSTEIAAGSTFPSLFGMIARRHMYQYGTTREHLSAVAVKNHENGALNPDAQMRKVITLEQALAGKPIADPLNLYDCSLISDGAAAVILVPYDRQAIRIRSVAQSSDYLALDRKEDITTFPSLRAAASQAYTQAGINPQQVEFAELHDCFTIAEIVAMEDLGFCERGQGGFFTAAGETRRSGRMPINASGGLKSKGHPVGATGAAQICDVVQQLRGEAGERQLNRHSLGLAQNLGGSGGTCVVSILERVQ